MNWSNILTPGPLPPPIPAGGVIEASGFVDWGAVVYNDQGVKGWLLAWDAREINTGASYKVYVTCGPKTEIDRLTPLQIKKRLEESSSHQQLLTRLQRLPRTLSSKAAAPAPSSSNIPLRPSPRTSELLLKVMGALKGCSNYLIN
ncbi:hypothetical protein RND81_03G146800 [Saponaria officinalis]|uniref:Uncharacterized protein n=1 Tax=Saponaria officinalis TaxID=3572 RepID=A0AAW1M0A8_SAPOF